jgi:hypothetical protein
MCDMNCELEGMVAAKLHKYASMIADGQDRMVGLHNSDGKIKFQLGIYAKSARKKAGLDVSVRSPGCLSATLRMLLNDIRT